MLFYAHQNSSQVIALLSVTGKKTRGEKRLAQCENCGTSRSSPAHWGQAAWIFTQLHLLKFGNSEKVSSFPYVLVSYHIKQTIPLS